MELHVAVRDGVDLSISEKDVTDATRCTLQNEGYDTDVPWEISVLFISTADITEMNSQYRKRDEPTDVISFCFTEGDGAEFAGHLLGDIVICPAVVQRNAEAYGVTERDELLYVLVHGVLHLTGNDHGTASDEREMGLKEQQIMRELGCGMDRFEH